MLKIKNIIIKNSIFSILQIVLSTVSYAIIYYLILHRLGKDELGVWSIITSLPIAISVFGSGVSGCVLRYIPVYNVQKDKKAFNEIIFNGVFFNAIFGGIMVFFGWFFSSDILHFLFSVKELPVRYIALFRISLLIFYLNFLSSILLFAIDGLQLIFLRNKIVIFCSLVFCIVASIFVCYWNLEGILFAQLIQSLLLLLIALVIILKVDFFDFSLLKFNKFYFKMFLTFGQGFQVIAITILIFEPITKYFLNSYFNLSTVGVYDIVSRAVTQTRILIVSAVQVITPLVSKNKEEQSLDVGEMFNKTTRGASLLSFVLFSTLICCSMVAVEYFDRDNGNQYLFILILLCVAYHFNIKAVTPYSILMGLGKLKNNIISHILQSGINIVLFLFIGKYLSHTMIVLPTALAIIISSEYVIYTFKKDFNVSIYSVRKSDVHIKILSLSTIILTTLFILFQINSIALIILFFLHTILLIGLVLKNDFFVGIFNKILNR